MLYNSRFFFRCNYIILFSTKCIFPPPKKNYNLMVIIFTVICLRKQCTVYSSMGWDKYEMTMTTG